MNTAQSVLALLLLSLAQVAAGAPEKTGTDEWHFAVSLDGRPIGEHDFTVTHRGSDLEVHTLARFKVKAFIVPLYHYEHDDHESWKDNCLETMQAHTNDNGKQLEVRGSRAGANFDVHGPKGEARLPACVRSFAYWDSAFLSQHHALNAQTGEYQPIQVSDQGGASIDVKGEATPAHRYQVKAGDFKIDLWYSAQGRWLALDSQTQKGRHLQYRLK